MGAQETMLSVVLVEDEVFDRRMLRECLNRYSSESGTEFACTEYAGGEAFLEQHAGTPDLIFMDIVMEGLDGMSTARQMRLRNETSILIFVTSMIQYAVQGYSVDATDFLIKPISYPLFKLCMDRALKKLRRNTPAQLTFSNREGSWSIPASEICYFESLDHKVYVHTISRTIPVDLSLAAVEKMTASLPFFRCPTSFLINLSYAEHLKGNDLWVHGERLSVSRYRRKEFLDAWAAFLGG